ncbi:MAG TPA: threonine synthase [Chloroflexota bacterium]|nr:threonine synthase [Chloroflexota bacterium]
MALIEGSYPVDRPGIIAHYREWLPVTESTPLFSLGEGFTPLVHARWLGDELGLKQLYLKNEGQNPTGSFKDRGMVMAVAKAIEEGASGIMCASTGNTSASAAAYGALAGMQVVVLIPNGNIAIGKLAQALHYGAKVVAVEGNFDDALRLIRVLTEKHRLTLVNSINPLRLEGQKTGAFEVCDALKRAPDYLAIPVGNAGNISAYWAGFKQYRAGGRITSTPRMLGFEAEGAAAIVRGEVIADPHTLATAIKIGNPASWQKAVAARDESGGRIESVTDDEIVAAYKLVSRLEGIFVEPASAASVAGVIKLIRAGEIEPDATVVCVLTGSGLKDPDAAIAHAASLRETAATIEAVERSLGWAEALVAAGEKLA